MSIAIIRGNEQFLRGFHAAQEARDFDDIYEYLFRPEEGYVVYNYDSGDLIIEEIIRDEMGSLVGEILDDIPEDIDYPLPDEYKED